MVKYKFKSWEDGSTNAARFINLKANIEITALYELVSEMSYQPSKSPEGTAKVKRETALTLDPLTLDVGEGATTTFTGKLTEASGPNIGVGIPNKVIHLFVNGNEVATATTGTDGSFSIDYTWATQGDYTYYVTYLGD